MNQIYITIQMHRQLDLEATKVALIMNMPVDEIRLIFYHQKNRTAEQIQPILQQFIPAKKQNADIDPMTWQYSEPK